MNAICTYLPVCLILTACLPSPIPQFNDMNLARERLKEALRKLE